MSLLKISRINFISQREKRKPPFCSFKKTVFSSPRSNLAPVQNPRKRNSEQSGQKAMTREYLQNKDLLRHSKHLKRRRTELGVVPFDPYL